MVTVQVVEDVALVSEIVPVLTDREVWARYGVDRVHDRDRSKKGKGAHGDDRGRESMLKNRLE